MPTPVDRAEVQRLLAERESAQLVEMLPEAEYEDERRPGAIRLPLNGLDIESVRHHLERGRPVLVYCYDSQ